MKYATYEQWSARVDSQTIPTDADGENDRPRVEALLDDAGARCMGVIPGALIAADGTQIPAAELPDPLRDGLVYWSCALVDCWLLAGIDGKRIEKSLWEEAANALQGIVQVTAHIEDD